MNQSYNSLYEKWLSQKSYAMVGLDFSRWSISSDQSISSFVWSIKFPPSFGRRKLFSVCHLCLFNTIISYCMLFHFPRVYNFPPPHKIALHFISYFLLAISFISFSFCFRKTCSFIKSRVRLHLTFLLHLIIYYLKYISFLFSHPPNPLYYCQVVIRAFMAPYHDTFLLIIYFSTYFYCFALLFISI